MAGEIKEAARKYAIRMEAAGVVALQGIVYGLSGDAMCETAITVENVLDGFVEVPCFECQGSGLFELPDGRQVKCNRCKGRLTELVMA